MTVSIESTPADFDIVENRPLNVATKSHPCVIHANGWEKLPLIDLVRRTGEITQERQEEILRIKSTFEKAKVDRLFDDGSSIYFVLQLM